MQSHRQEILPKSGGAKRFTKLDASNTHWRIPIDESSSKLLTLNSPIGRYRFLCMPYGIHSASDMCQQRIAQIIENIEGAKNSQDDIIIWGENSDKLQQRTIKVFESVRKHGLKLNISKCQFDQSEIIFLCHKITAEGIHSDHNKVEAIQKMPCPSDVKGLQWFLGMVNYSAKFILNLSSHTIHLCKLLEKGSVWSFENIHR